MRGRGWVHRLFMWDNGSNTLCVGLKKRLVIYQYNGLEFLEVRFIIVLGAHPHSTQGSAATATGTSIRTHICDAGLLQRAAQFVRRQRTTLPRTTLRAHPSASPPSAVLVGTWTHRPHTRLKWRTSMQHPTSRLTMPERDSVDTRDCSLCSSSHWGCCNDLVRAILPMHTSRLAYK